VFVPIKICRLLMCAKTLLLVTLFAFSTDVEHNDYRQCWWA